MMRRLFLAGLACLLGSGVIHAQARRAPDVEFWDEVDLSARLVPKLTVTVPLVLRDSVSRSNPQLYGVGPLFDYSIAKHATLTGGYLFVGLPTVGTGNDVHVPLAAVTLKGTLRRLEASDRNRAESLVGLPDNPIRYRNKLVLSLPLADGRWQPFASDEVFYDFSKSAWTQNRFQAGIGHELNARLRLDLFYLERNARKGNPAATHAVGTTLQIKLTRRTHREGLPHEEN